MSSEPPTGQDVSEQDKGHHRKPYILLTPGPDSLHLGCIPLRRPPHYKHHSPLCVFGSNSGQEQGQEKSAVFCTSWAMSQWPGAQPGGTGRGCAPARGPAAGLWESWAPCVVLGTRQEKGWDVREVSGMVGRLGAFANHPGRP